MKILSDILNLNVLELNSLIFSLESVFNLSSITNEKNDIRKDNSEIIEEVVRSYDVILNSYLPDKKISILKTIKILFNLGLKETKDILDNVPKTITTVNNIKEAEEYKQKIEESGGKVIIKQK